MIPTRPTEEIGTYSVLSKADHIDDLESPVDKTDKVAKISPRAEIEGHEEQCDKEVNGSDHEGRNEEENSEGMKKDNTEKKMFLKTIWKMLMIWVLFKELLKAFIARNAIKQLKV